jgi:hypothetical protein
VGEYHSSEGEKTYQESDDGDDISPTEAAFILIIDGREGRLDKTVFGWSALKNCFLHVV